jgi:hypothetical protein
MEPINPLIDLNKFPEDWVRTQGFIPSDPRATIVGGIRRKLIVSAFPVNRYPELNWPVLNEHERWLASVTRWLRTIRSAKAAYEFKEPELYAKLRSVEYCRPPGYRGDPRNGRVGTRCNNRLCPWCHARKGVGVFHRLKAAFKAAPKTEPIYIGLISDDRKTGVTDLNKEVLRRKIAAGSGVKYPIAVDGSKLVWGFKVIILADNLKSVKGIPYMPLTGVGGIAVAIGRWFSYPAIWSSPTSKIPDPAFCNALRLCARLPNAPRVVLNFGACRADHDSTKSVLGFKLTQLQIDYMLNRKDPQCPQRSPPSGSSATPCSTSPLPPSPSDQAPKTQPPQS